MRASPLVTLLVTLTLIGTGCLTTVQDTLDPAGRVTGVDYDHLGADGAKVMEGRDWRTFLWDGVIGAGGTMYFVGEVPHSEHPGFTFQVDRTVGFVEAHVAPEGAGATLFVLDEKDRVACAVVVRKDGGACTAAAPPDADAPVEYTAKVMRRVGYVGAEEIPFKLNVTLKGPAHIPDVDLAGELDARFAFMNHDTGFRGGEPTLGLTSDGTLFAVEGSKTVRSRDDGATWEDVTPPGTTITFDPMLFVDPWTDRVFSNHLYVACSYLSWSDDQGDSWVTNPAACGTPANDHQKVAVGGHFLPSPAFDGIVYYSYASFGEGIWVSRSLDGGVTWTSALAMSEAQGFDYRTGGPVVADRDGNVYVAAYLSGGDVGVTASNDHGATFTPVRIANAGSGSSEGIDPGVAVDADGNAFVAYWGPDGVKVAASTDKGASWSTPVTVSPPSLQSFVLADTVAGDAGRVAVAYLATAESAKGPNRADAFAKWHLYVSVTEDALAADPEWVTARVTPEGDPVQIGSICTGGISCFGGNRNLLDFIDVQAGPDGRVYVAYTDGCVASEEGPCRIPQESRERRGYVAVQTEGPRLFVDGAPWAS